MQNSVVFQTDMNAILAKWVFTSIMTHHTQVWMGNWRERESHNLCKYTGYPPAMETMTLKIQELEILLVK